MNLKLNKSVKMYKLQSKSFRYIFFVICLFLGKNRKFAHLINANITSDFCLSKYFLRFFNKL